MTQMKADKIRRWWIRISCAALWSAATWRRFPHTTRNTQGPGFASRDHYNVNDYILTSSAVVGIDDAGIYSGGLKPPGWSITDRGCSKGSKSGRERIKTPLEQSGALSQTAIPLMLYVRCPNAFN